jgi:GNAT superfamily N-acetyltransferase
MMGEWTPDVPDPTTYRQWPPLSLLHLMPIRPGRGSSQTLNADPTSSGQSGCVWTTPDAGTATLWIPPGEPELPPAQAVREGALWKELLGPDVWRATIMGEAFERAHPRVPKHYYLSLFGTRPDRRGQGLGMSLLANNLARIDAEGAPAYLESTNPANLDRYRSVGFADHGEFELGEAGPVVTTMWRGPNL